MKITYDEDDKVYDVYKTHGPKDIYSHSLDTTKEELVILEEAGIIKILKK